MRVMTGKISNNKGAYHRHHKTPEKLDHVLIHSAVEAVIDGLVTRVLPQVGEHVRRRCQKHGSDLHY